LRESWTRRWGSCLTDQVHFDKTDVESTRNVARSSFLVVLSHLNCFKRAREPRDLSNRGPTTSVVRLAIATHQLQQALRSTTFTRLQCRLVHQLQRTTLAFDDNSRQLEECDSRNRRDREDRCQRQDIVRAKRQRQRQRRLGSSIMKLCLEVRSELRTICFDILVS